MDLRDRVVVVTGAAGGIGAATARAFAARGARPWLVDLDEAGLARVAATLPGAVARRVDVADAEAVEALAAAVDREAGGAAVVVNNAGVTVLGDFADHTVADWQRVMGVNLFGVVHGCRSFLPQLRRGGGRLVNVSSLFGLVGIPGQTAYCASKFAVRGFSEALAEELRGTGVGVTLVHPGGVRTGIVANARVAAGDAAGVEALGRFFAERAVPPERVGARIVRAVERGEHRVRVCAETFVADWLRRAAPEAGNRLAVAAMLAAMGVAREG